jgi:hypothetical protein
MHRPDEPMNRSRRLGYEVRDVNVTLVLVVVIVFVLLGLSLHVLLWGLSRAVVPESAGDGASPPVVMPGEPPVNDRLKAVPPPRLDGLDELKARPPSYRSSRPVPRATSLDIHPEDLRANRQPRLQGYGWIDRGKGIARIPIDRAMDAVVESEQGKPAGKKGGQP